MIRVLIAGREPPARRKVRAFSNAMRRSADLEAGLGRGSDRRHAQLCAGLVFLDVQMPDIDGFAVLAAAPEPVISTRVPDRASATRASCV